MNKNISPFNDKGVQHGYWERYNYNGELWYKCVYINGKLNGFEEFHWNDGKISSKYYHL